MVSSAVSNSGPIIHLAEIDKLVSFKPWQIFIPVEVGKEISKISIIARKVKSCRFIKEKELTADSKDFSKKVAIKFELDLGEADTIALAKQEKIRLFFTDDLDAREAARELSLEVHGSVGILLRAFRKKVISKQEALQSLDNLRGSTLYITSDLINYAKREVEQFSKNR